MTSREFNQHTSRAKAAADRGPVIVTDRGKPAYVLLSHDEFERITGKRKFVSAFEALADPNYNPEYDVDLIDFIPERTVDPPRDQFGDDD
jgi:prevent-host-death family protein